MSTNDHTTKVCKKCGVSSPPTNYHKNSSYLSGLNSICKPCARERTAQWRRDNPDRARLTVEQWFARNPERAAQYQAEYRQRNRASRRASRAQRRAAEKQAAPPWVDRAAIMRVYAEARRRDKKTGIPHHVDHIIPLQHPSVCGLHVPWNLQVITAAENWRKRNYLPPLDTLTAQR